MKVVLLTLAVLFALFAAGLIWGWEWWVFDNPAWRRHASGWGFLSFAAYAAAGHPLIPWIDRHLDGRASQP